MPCRADEEGRRCSEAYAVAANGDPLGRDGPRGRAGGRTPDWRCASAARATWSGLVHPSAERPLAVTSSLFGEQAPRNVDQPCAQELPQALRLRIAPRRRRHAVAEEPVHDEVEAPEIRERVPLDLERGALRNEALERL